MWRFGRGIWRKVLKEKIVQFLSGILITYAMIINSLNILNYPKRKTFFWF